MNENNKGPPLSEGVGTSGCVNTSNKIISDDSMREMIRYLNSSRQIFDEVYNWCKSEYQNSLIKTKVDSLKVFISGGASRIFSIVFFRHWQELSIFILAHKKRLKYYKWLQWVWRLLTKMEQLSILH